jgi:hypothetical protein
MAISAVSSISAGDQFQLFRGPSIGPMGPFGKASTVPRVQAIPSLAVREDADSARKAAEDRKRETARLSALDPRGPQSIVASRDRDGDRERASNRLDELLGEKAAIERREADQKGRSSAAIVGELSQLKARDGAVRAHEAAHIAAGGRYITGGASYEYETGPDGVQYAVGGEVGIDTSPVPGKPEETVEKMRTIRAAALAPSDPSAADLSVAAAAAQMEAEALAELAQSRADDAAGRYGSEAKAADAATRRPLDMVA